MNETEEKGWRIQRQVGLGVVVAVALQTAGALIWAGATGERIRQLEAQVEAMGPLNERLARVEEHAAHTRAALERIERRLGD